MKANVLVIDEKRESQKEIKNYLDDNICNVYSVGDTINGLKLFKEKNINIIICDIQTPSTDGIEFIQQIKQRRPEASIVAISEGAKADYFSLSQDSVADRFLHKPFSKSELVDTCNSIGYFI